MISRTHTLVVSALVLAAACTTSDDAGEVPDYTAEEEIRAQEMVTDVTVLAADSMRGRATATPGKRMAAEHIADRFREAGLQPVDGSWFQEVRLVGMKKDSPASTLSIRGPGGELPLVPVDNVAFWSTSQEATVDIRDAPLLFAGYGVDAPEHDWDDYKDADVEGKVLLFLNNDPPVSEDGVELFGGEARTYYGRWTYKFEQAMARGAAGALMIHTTPSASYPFSVIQNAGQRESWALDLPGSGYQVPMVGWLSQEMSERIAGAMGTDVDGLFTLGRSRDFQPTETGFTVNAHIETTLRNASTRNVMGMLEGRDPELQDQVIAFTAHYDHLGTDGSMEGDTIFNGAWDNASGTAGIVALARAFATTEPAPGRSVIFLAVAAEESGSLGSRWFVTDPPFERSRLVANFNVDMPQIFGLTRDLGAIGVEMNSLGEALRGVAADIMVEGEEGGEAPLRITGDPNPAAGSFYRSDQVNFAKAGIPALFIRAGQEYVTAPAADPDAYREEHYHQPSDEYRAEVWDLTGLERDLRVLYRTALTVANAPEMPRWNPGNEFEDEWRTLHGR